MRTSRQSIRLYAMGIIIVLLGMSIPEVQIRMQSVMYSPEAGIVIQTVKESGNYYVDKSKQTIVGLIQHIQPAKNIVINNNVIAPIDTKDNFSLTHGQSVSIEQCETILATYNSPAVNTCEKAIQYAQKHNIDFAYPLYMFIHESSAGTNKQWAGIKPDNQVTHNTGNIICAGYDTCYGRFRDYESWDEGWQDHIDLLVYYRDKQGDETLEEAITRWAPPIENDTSTYYENGKDIISGWREFNAQNTKILTSTKIIPITKSMQVLSNFYAMGAVWCFQDANCPKDANGNPLGKGQHFGIDIYVAANEPVYAPVDGTFVGCGSYSDSARIGEYVIYLTYDGYEFYSGHLANTVLFCQKSVGDKITAGEIMGYGNANVSGPHTHIQLRKDGQLLDYLQYYDERN